jgi:uncharacterized protein YbjQ (UPF0145 family)
MDRPNDTKGADDASAAGGADAPETSKPGRRVPHVVSQRNAMNTPNCPPTCIATTDGVAGARIAATLGVVVGLAVRTRGVGGNIMAGLDAIGNCGALAEYRDDLIAIRREALARMAAEAEGLGANAVVGVRFDAAEVGREMVEVVAYGTAVVLQDS